MKQEPGVSLPTRIEPAGRRPAALRPKPENQGIRDVA